MDTQPQPPGSQAPQRIDLTRETDVDYWCRVFNVSIAQLREAVHHAGHQADEVRRFLAGKTAP